MNTTTTATQRPTRQSSLPAGGKGTAGRWAPLFGGIALLLGGLWMLGYAAWEYYGTDVVARHRQSELREELLARWEYPTVADVLGPQSTSTPLGSADALVRIPRLGFDYEVPLIEGVRDEDLSRGIGHFPGTGPGQTGNFAVAAHRATNGEPFRDLPEMRPGDEVVVETADATYTYQLDTDPNDLVVSFTEDWVIDPVPVAPEGEAPPGMRTFASASPTAAIITLTTSSELFHADDRLVAFGHLVSTTSK